MDAVEFIKDLKRMCNSELCDKCPAMNHRCSFFPSNPSFVKTGEGLVRTVEEWAKKHPVKTRQSEFLKHFQKAYKDAEGIILLCPKEIEDYDKCAYFSLCHECRKNYWLTEVE